jgi:lycopene beta-cyclase
MKKKFDYIIAGAGCAGLSLALKMSQDRFFDNKKILLLDRDNKTQNDRTWCFWAESALGLEEIIAKKWQTIVVKDDKNELNLPLKSMRYFMLRGKDFYDFAKRKIFAKSNFTFQITEIEEINTSSVKCSNGDVFSAEYVFDSLSLPVLKPKTNDYLFIYQHFTGWFVKTEKKCFDPDKVTMFDFRCEQGRDLRFFYILPLSENEALVEFTIFGETLFQSEFYENELRKYFDAFLNTGEYIITEKETGIIPMTNFPFENTPLPKVRRIGTAGGMCKASTGYAFYLIQKDSEKIINDLKEGTLNVPSGYFRNRFQIYDSMLLNVFIGQKLKQAPLFMQLFQKNQTEVLLRFLSNETNFIEELSVMSSVPPVPFLMSLFQIIRENKLQL